MRIDAFNKVVAICFELRLTVEVETGIVIDVADEINARGSANDEQVGRVWTIATVHRFFLIGRYFRHQNRKVTFLGSKVSPATVVRPGLRRQAAGGSGRTPGVFLGLDRKAQR